MMLDFFLPFIIAPYLLTATFVSPHLFTHYVLLNCIYLLFSCSFILWYDALSVRIGWEKDGMEWAGDFKQ